MIIIGIDNGLSGGIAAISALSGMLIETAPMPTKTRTHLFEKTTKRRVAGKPVKETAPARDEEIDARALVQWIKRVTDARPCTILIEECPEHAQQKSVMRSMGISYGILIGAIEASLPEYCLKVVRSGNPKDSWQRAMFGALAQGETKPAAIAKARELWPAETWLATPRSKTPHTGMIDAALIARHGLNLNLDTP